MASSNHQQRTGQYISLCSLELHNFKYWLNRQNPENIKASLTSVIDHDTNEVHCHVNINWSPNTPDQDTFPIHFRDMRKSTVLLPGDLRNLDSTLVQQWQERVLKHIIERRMIHQNERPTRTHDERQAILNKTTQIMADLRVNQPEHSRWIKWYSIDTAPPTPQNISNGYTLIVNLKPINGHHQITHECKIDNFTILHPLIKFEERLQATLSQHASDYGLHPKMIWIEKFCNWVHNTGLPNSQEKLKSELVPANNTRRARIQIELVNTYSNLRNTHITTIKVTNDPITLSIFNQWKTTVMNQLHKFMRQREKEYLPPRCNSGLRDDEYSDNEENPINFDFLTPQFEGPSIHIPNPPTNLPTTAQTQPPRSQHDSTTSSLESSTNADDNRTTINPQDWPNTMNWIRQTFPHRSVHTLPASFFLPALTRNSTHTSADSASPPITMPLSMPILPQTPIPPSMPTLTPTPMPTPRPTTLVPRPSTPTTWRGPTKRSTQSESSTYGPASGQTPPKRPSPPTHPDYFTAEEQAVPRLMPVLNRLQISSSPMSPTTTTSTMTSTMSSTTSAVSSTSHSMPPMVPTVSAPRSSLAHRRVTREEFFFYPEEDFETEDHFKSERDTE